MRIIDTHLYKFISTHVEPLETELAMELNEEETEGLREIEDDLGESPEAWRGWWILLDRMYKASFLDVKDAIMTGVMCGHIRRHHLDVSQMALTMLLHSKAFQIVVEREKALAAEGEN
jgi:hypothetical protein